MIPSHSNSQSLPSWASYARQRDPGQSSLANEERQLRTKAYEHASMKVNSAYNQTIDYHVENISKPLCRFFLQFQPGASVGEKSRRQKRQRRQNSNDDGEDNGGRTQQAFKDYIDSIQYHPTLLPIANLHLSPSSQDRYQIVKSLKRKLSNFTKKADDFLYPGEIQRDTRVSSVSTKFRPAVCILSDVPNSRGFKDHGECIREILLQCIQQENDPYQFTHLLAKRSTKSLKLGYSNRLVEWAGSTRAFNSIVIILENPEVIARRNLNAFLGTILSLRSDAGVPVCLVLNSVDLGTEDSGEFFNGMNLNGEAGIVFKDFSLAFSQSLFCELFHNLYTKKALPILLSKDMLRNMQKDFYQFDGSLATVAMQIKKALAEHFSKRGTFFSMTDERFLSKYGFYLAWFSADMNARKMIFGKNNKFHNSWDVLRTMSNTFDILRYRLALCNIVNVVKTWASIDVEEGKQITNIMPFIMLHQAIRKSKDHKELLENLHDKLRSEPAENVTEMLAHCYKAVQEITFDSSAVIMTYLHPNDSENHITSPDTDRVQELSKFLKTGIFSVECEIENQDPGITRHFREILVEKFNKLLWEDADEWSHTTFLRFITFGIEDGEDRLSYLSSSSIEPRRSISSSISSPEYLNHDRSFDMRIAMHALDTRILSTNDWLGQFAEKLSLYSDDKLSQEEIFYRFSFAVYQLMYCGFAIRSRRKNGSYEKSAMVWAKTNL